MARINISELPIIRDASASTVQQVVTRMYELLRAIALQLNALSEGSIAGKYSARTAPPTAGTFKRGDRIANLEPAELGSVGAKYIITEWVCVTSGTPGVWKESRCLTGA